MNDQTSTPPPLRLLFIIWAQQLVSLVIFGGALVYINQGQPAVTDQLIPAGPVLGMTALSSIGLGLFLRYKQAGTLALPFLMEQNSTPWEEGLEPGQADEVKTIANGKYKTATIIGTACTEAAALFGFALAALTKMSVIYLPFAGAAGVIILWQIPNQQSLDAVCRAVLKKKQSQT